MKEARNYVRNYTDAWQDSADDWYLSKYHKEFSNRELSFYKENAQAVRDIITDLTGVYDMASEGTRATRSILSTLGDMELDSLGRPKRG